MIRRTHLCIVLLLIATQLLSANEDRYNTEVIKEYALDANTVYNIPIGNTPTTVTFPGPLVSIDGANISNNPSNKAPVLLSYVDGHYYFSVRAVLPKAQAAVNVVHNGQTYVFNFYHKEDSIPYRTVRLLGADAETSYGSSRPRWGHEIHKISPTALLSLLDRSKSHYLINEAYPGKLDGVEHRMPDNMVTEYKDFTASVDEIFRFNKYDTLVFKINLHSTSKDPIYYQPQSVAIRIGQNLYFPSIADASGIIPPDSGSVAYIAITGKPNGERADLSIKNQFQVIVSKVSDPAKLVIP
ncbi:hypothetical protein QEH59_14625 [Coraliomargarita sp. SDUM461004]|uniref:DUF4138 domain-containing protein n=1 Tax=Thalassobacterium sedimentorum TaxID=3041258 RepID=A0ABU1APJ1_9BACT|nr:hypothetical protein [Coraliomargarita sp. SDUM461004]MDQ8195666.1 hypothetical protein [Coraliomargarita sp. SDUM461004]